MCGQTLFGLTCAETPLRFIGKACKLVYSPLIFFLDKVWLRRSPKLLEDNAGIFLCIDIRHIEFY